LLQVVNDILDFSKIEAGKLTLESVPFNLYQLLQDVIHLFRPIVSPQVELLLALESDVPASLIGDPGRLRQVIMNLLGNAVKFTHQGHVTLQVRREKTSSVYVALTFLVVDTGIGMPEHKLAKLFERFDQADASISGKYGGTGLGLSIAKELVTLMGGYISVTSTPGKGTTMLFNLTLLVDEPSPAESQTAAPEIPDKESSSLRSLAHSIADARGVQRTDTPFPVRVLLVDDVAVNLTVAAAMLTRDGCIVTVASNGREAVKLSEQNSYDIILMDCQMPEMDGYEATALIRKSEAGRRTPIIAVTASIAKEQQDGCFAAGMDDFISKPVDPQELRNVVRKWAIPSSGAVTMGSRNPE
jgi:CheY-like chemotaxis protein/anti-sigma regulatory factor (Ser/Thr protein kinase)